MPERTRYFLETK